MALLLIAQLFELSQSAKKNKVTKEADAEVEATTKEPKAEAKTKEPPTLKESIDTSVNMTACCAFCSVLCICTIPSLIPVFIAACVLAVARRKMDAGDEERAKHLISIANIMNIVTLVFYISLVIAGVVIIFSCLPVIIISAS